MTVPSSTSSSEQVLPVRLLGRTWLVALVLVAIGLGGTEAFWRSHDYGPSLRDNKELWALQRRRVERCPPATVVLLGASRMQTDFATEVFYRRFPGVRLVDLAIDGRPALAALKDLAHEESFKGYVVCAATADVFEHRSMAAQQPWVDYYHSKFRLNTLLNTEITAWMDGHLTFRNVLLSPYRAAWTLVQTRGLPQEHLLTRTDRSRQLDFTHYDDAAHVERRLRRRRERVRKLSPDQFMQAAQTVETWVKRIQSRGGKVAFVRFPTTGDAWPADEVRYPRALYWDRFAALTGAVTVHFRDYPALSCYECPDTAHLDYSDAPAFTNALLDVLARRRVLPDR